MHIEGSREFAASRDEVFDALTDPHLVASTLPGVERMEVLDDESWHATVKLPVAPRLDFHFQLRERRPPEHARVEGTSKSLGSSARLETSFDLAETDGRTRMDYVATLALGGLLRGVPDAALRPIVEHQIGGLLRAVERRVGG